MPTGSKFSCSSKTSISQWAEVLVWLPIGFPFYLPVNWVIEQSMKEMYVNVWPYYVMISSMWLDIPQSCSSLPSPQSTCILHLRDDRMHSFETLQWNWSGAQLTARTNTVGEPLNLIQQFSCLHVHCLCVCHSLLRMCNYLITMVSLK